MEPSTLSFILKQELDLRTRRNPKYSLRAFARSLAVDPSTLSKVISGKRVVQAKSRDRILAKLGVASSEAGAEFPNLNESSDLALSEWLDYAILEQINVTNFGATKARLATVLGAARADVESSLAKLVALRMIKIGRGGIIKDISTGVSSNITPTTTTARKQALQKQFLEKAIASIDFDPLDCRDMTSITVAVDSTKIEEAKRRIKKFRRELGIFLSSSEKTDSVYQLSVALFPLSSKIKDQ